MKLSNDYLFAVFLALAFYSKTTKASQPLCVLKCITVVSSSCREQEADSECLCGQKDSIIGCLADICQPSEFLLASNHVNEVCLSPKKEIKTPDECQLDHDHDDSCGSKSGSCNLNHKHNDTCGGNDPWHCNLDHEHSDICGKKECELCHQGNCTKHNDTNVNLEGSLQLESWSSGSDTTSDSDDESFENFSDDSDSSEESYCSDESDSDCDSEYDSDEYEEYGYENDESVNAIYRREGSTPAKSNKQLGRELKPSKIGAYSNTRHPFKDKIPVQTLPKLNNFNPVLNAVEDTLENIL